MRKNKKIQFVEFCRDVFNVDPGMAVSVYDYMMKEKGPPCVALKKMSEK